MIYVGLSHISFLNEEQFGKYRRLIEVSKFIKNVSHKKNSYIYASINLCYDY